MLNREIIQKELIDEEGLKLTSYKCTSGRVTIGIGHNCAAKPTIPLIGKHIHKVGQRITKEDADILFQHDLDEVTRQLDKYLPWWKDCPDFVQYVLISLVFNMGIYGVLEFRITLGYMHKHDWKNAAYHLKSSKWYNQVGRRGPKLCNILLGESI